MIEKRTVERIMQYHIGRKNTITRKEILDLMFLKPTDANQRQLRLVMAELRHDGFPLLFATETPSGFYLPSNLSELEEGLNKVRSYIKTECIALRDLKVKGRIWVQGESQGVLL